MPYFISAYVSLQVWFFHMLCCAVLMLSLLYMLKIFYYKNLFSRYYFWEFFESHGYITYRRLLPEIYLCLEAFLNATNHGY